MNEFTTIADKTHFPTLLAFSVHEMKNSLSSINELIRNFNEKDKVDNSKDLGQLEFETNRVNNTLMQLLILYKIEEVHFTPNIDECFAIDILMEVLLQQVSLFAMNGLELNIDCAEDLICYCDQNLICNVLGTMANNVQRYAKKQVLLSARRENGYVIFRVDDDGEGFPEHLLNANKLDSSALNLNSGSTGLGLFFASKLAKMHINKEQAGYISLNNQGELGGGAFSIFLP